MPHWHSTDATDRGASDITRSRTHPNSGAGRTFSDGTDSGGASD